MISFETPKFSPQSRMRTVCHCLHNNYDFFCFNIYLVMSGNLPLLFSRYDKLYKCCCHEKTKQ